MTAGGFRQRTRLNRVLCTALIVIAIGTAAWLGRMPLLKGVADLWIVSDTVEPADAVAIFGGGLDIRPFAAAKYYHDGIVKKIVISSVRSGSAEQLGIISSHVEVTRRVLLALGVPEAAIGSFGTANTNTHDEAISLADWAKNNKASRVIVPTEIFSARRVRWTTQREFAETGAQVRVPALETPDYNRSNWWAHESGVLAFQNEVIKYIYYRLKY